MTTLRGRVALFGGVLVGAVVVAFGIVVIAGAAIGHVRQEDQNLSEDANLLAPRIEQVDLATARLPTGVGFDVTRSPLAYIEVLDGGGNVLFSSGELNGSPPPVSTAALSAAPLGTTETTTERSGGVSLRLAIRRLDHIGSSPGGYVVVGESQIGLQREVGLLVILGVIAGAVALVVALLGLRAVAGRALRPLQTVAATADEIGRTGDVSRRLPPQPSGDELEQLSSSFNGMLARLAGIQAQLDSALSQQRRFVADASHELRTPLTSIQSNLDFLRSHPDAAAADRDQAFADISAEAERMRRMVEDLLVLARAESGHHLTLVPLDLGALISDVGGRAQRLHADRTITVESGAARADGDADSLTQLIWILVRNAVQHTATGGTIRIRCQASAAGTDLTVDDDGEGIPEADLPRIFERFHRAPATARGEGSGLGLAIAAWICAEHHGTISAANRPEGGASFHVHLPPASP